MPAMVDMMTIMLAGDVADLPAALDKPRPEQTSGEKVTAWLCHGTQCLPPITDLGELLSALGTQAAP